MTEPDRHDITRLLRESARDGEAMSALLPLVYDELRRLARRYMSGERRDHTLQTTALVHEAGVRLVDAEVPYADRLANVIGGELGMKASELPAARSRERIGAYEIVEEIGRGGMATVLLAVRADDQYRKKVATKLVRPEVLNPDVKRRFRSERQILANVEHPNIARLLDGGETDDGLPYLVMEYIDGEPIDV